MAKLPNETALGGAPSFRTGRAVVSGDELGLEERGKALQRLGRAGQSVSDDLERKARENTAIDLVRADANLKSRMYDVEREFDEDPDYGTYDKRFEERSKKLREQSADLIRDPAKREQWLATHAQIEVARARNGVLDKGARRAKEARFVALGDALTQHARVYTDPAANEDRRARALNDMETSITVGERSGILNPKEAQLYRRTFIEGAQIGDAEIRIQTDPEGLLRDLTGGPDLDMQDNPEARPKPLTSGDTAKDAAILATTRLETGKSNPLEGVSNISRDSGGTRSYGNFGLNSGGSAQRFVDEYGADLGLTAEPGTAEFDAQWKNAAAAAPVELHAAEVDWWNKNVADGLTAKLTRAGIPEAAARDPRVVTYFADRIVQQGPASISKHARRIAAAWRASGDNAEAFLRAMSEADRNALQQDFPTALRTGVYSEEGHNNRIAGREQAALRTGSGETEQAFGIGQPRVRYAGMSPGTRLDLITKANKALEVKREAAADRQRAEGILAGRLLVDPGSKEDRDSIDKAFSGLGGKLSQSDPQAAATVTDLAKRTGYVPDEALGQLRALSVNGTAEQKTYAYEVAANIMREKPGIFEGGDKVKRLKGDASLYETYTVEMGLTAPQAVQRIDELRTPEFEKRRKAMKEEIEGGRSFVSKITASDLTSLYDVWYSSAPELGGSARQGPVILGAYRDLVEEHYIRTGDEEVAKSMAQKDIQRSYGVSEITGNKRLMRHPPEKNYPAVARTEDETPGLRYFTDELVAAVNEARFDGAVKFTQDNPETRASRMGAASRTNEIPLSDIYIEPIPQTAMDISARRAPGYGVVWFEDRDGIRVMQSAPGLIFRADWQGATRQQNEWRNRVFREREAEAIYRRQITERIGIGDVEMGTGDVSDIRAPYTADQIERAYRQAEETRSDAMVPEPGTMAGFMDEEPTVPTTRPMRKLFGDGKRIPIGPAPNYSEIARRMRGDAPND